MTYNENQFNLVRQAIVDKLATATNIADAKFAETSNFENFPVAVVGVSDQPGDFHSNKNDRFELGFTVTLYYPVDDDNSIEAADKAMGIAYWETLMLFRNRKLFDGIAGLENISLQPTPSSWGFETSPDAVYRSATLNVIATVYLTLA